MGGIEPPSRDSKSHMITTTPQEISQTEIYIYKYTFYFYIQKTFGYILSEVFFIKWISLKSTYFSEKHFLDSLKIVILTLIFCHLKKTSDKMYPNVFPDVSERVQSKSLFSFSYRGTKFLSLNLSVKKKNSKWLDISYIHMHHNFYRFLWKIEMINSKHIVKTIEKFLNAFILLFIKRCVYACIAIHFKIIVFELEFVPNVFVIDFFFWSRYVKFKWISEKLLENKNLQ